MTDLNQKIFNIIVCGAGIAGLCAGIGLAQLGHLVTILESAHELTPIGIGIHLPPNATLVLKHFGLLDKLSEDAIHPSTFSFRRWADNKLIASTKPAQSSTSPDAPPYWSMRRSDYQRHLYRAAIDAGCQIRLNSRVEEIDTALPTVTLIDGEILKADFVVVADGIKSKLRDFVIPEERTSIIRNSMSSFRAYVSRSDLLNDPITSTTFQESATNVWAGSNRHIIVYPCGGDLYTVGATHPAKDIEAMEWTQSASCEQAREEYRDWTPVVDRVLYHSKDVKQWRLAEVPRLPRWTSKSGRVVLVGDAAHAMVQFLAQGAAMATEDAAALAECVKIASKRSDLPTALKAYEQSRKWRCEIVQSQSRRNGEMIHMPDGVEQECRDRKMAGLPHSGLWEVDLGPMFDDEFRNFLYNHNVVEHTQEVLRSLTLVQ